MKPNKIKVTKNTVMSSGRLIDISVIDIFLIVSCYWLTGKLVICLLGNLLLVYLLLVDCLDLIKPNNQFSNNQFPNNQFSSNQLLI